MAYTVGVNAPGYLPDAEPVTCPDYESAFFQLCADLVATREALHGDDDAEADAKLDAATCAASAASKDRAPFMVQAFGLAHWIAPADAPAPEGKPGARDPRPLDQVAKDQGRPLPS